MFPDPDLGRPERCRQVARPTILYQAHTAPLGLAFYTGTRFPAEYRGDLFVALHGSWNRSTPTGHTVIRVRFDGGAPRAEDFASGWLSGPRGWGRPVDVAVGADGSLFVSDDRQGVVYRITYPSRLTRYTERINGSPAALRGSGPGGRLPSERPDP